VYTAVRRYVTTNSRACAVLVLNPPEFELNTGYTASLRRALQSEKFTERFENYPYQARKAAACPSESNALMTPISLITRQIVTF